MRYLRDGTLCELDTPALSALDRGFTLGDGVFETIAVRRGEPLRLQRHLDRLLGGLATLAFAQVPARATLAEQAAAVIAANDLAEGVLRISVSRGRGGRGPSPGGCATPSVLMTVSDRLPPDGPARLIVSTRTRRNEHSPLSRIKSLSYLDSVIAVQEAEAQGADDALLLNTAGYVAESAVGNIFAQLDDTLLTPPVADGALPGIARAEVLAGFGAEERRLDLATLLQANGVILTNSVRVRPVLSIDGTSIGDGVSHRLARDVQAALGLD